MGVRDRAGRTWVREREGGGELVGKGKVKRWSKKWASVVAGKRGERGALHRESKEVVRMK